jgi:mutual gliding-motility protein MglA
MSSVNVSAKEISLKIVYYGPGLGGKTSSLQHIHRAIKPEARGQLISLATGADRTLYFDFLPVRLPKLRGYTIRVQLYTVPGQVHYNSTRKLVLTGADGLVFVADSQRDRKEANVESLDNLRENLAEQGHALDKIPHLFQYNKRDVLSVQPVPEMEAALNRFKAPYFETCATSGHGVFEALKSITTLVLSDLRRRGVWRGENQAAPQRSDEPTPLTELKEEPSDPGLYTGRGPTTDGSISASLQALTGDPDEEMLGGGEPLRPLEPENARAESTPAARSLGLSEILPAGAQRDQVVAVEYLIHRGDYAGAVAKAAKLFADAATAHPAVASRAGHEGPALHALMLGIPGGRYLRFREITVHAAGGGASSADALFALYFLVDAVLRANGENV